MSRTTADVVVVGAGIVGLNVAYQIGRRSDLRVIVVEKGAGVAEGSTGASIGLLRQLYTQTEMVRLARDGLRAYRDWSAYTGLAEPRARFHASGALWMFGKDRAGVAADRDRLAAEGIAADVLDAAGVRDRFPALSTCAASFDLSGEVEHQCVEMEAALFEPDAAYVTPVLANEDLLEAARAAGVEVRFRSPVSGVPGGGGRVQGVTLADGTVVDAGVVVNAAGPWCSRIDTMAGFDNPWRMVPTRIQVGHRTLPPEVPRPLPFVGDMSSGVYFRPEAGGQQLLFGSLLEEDEMEEVDPSDFRTTADRSFVDSKIHGVHHRLPSLPHRGDVGGIAGLYTVNRSDAHPIVGPTEIEGYVVCNGFSGHGFKEAPMVGSLIAQWLTGERAEFDTEVPIGFFAVDREPIPMQWKGVLA